jgi:phosphomevalonate kinase
MSELTTYNKVWCWMEQCQVGDNLWVKADEAEQQIAYWKRCVETSKSIHQIDNETIRKQLDTISELQGEIGSLKQASGYWNDKYSETFDKFMIADYTAGNWKFCGISCFVIALAEAIFIGVKLL